MSDPKPWKKDHNPQDFVSTQDWTPRVNGEHVQIQWGKYGYESAAIWENGLYWLLVPNSGDCPNVGATHWRRLTLNIAIDPLIEVQENNR